MIYNPLILFTYKRLDHLKKTLESLSQAKGVKNVELFLFSDGWKNDNDKKQVLEVRKFLKEFNLIRIFKNVTIKENSENLGLANSIIFGVTSVLKKYNSAIVLEDDNIVTRDFFIYFNEGLEFYENRKEILTIGGSNIVQKFPNNYSNNVYFLKRTCSYSWATWKDRWSTIDWEVKDYKNFRYNLLKRFQFNKYGNDRTLLLDLQMKKKIDSWAIRMCFNHFKTNRFTVYPVFSKVNNIGNDGTGTHKNNIKENKIKNINTRSNPTLFTNDILENKRIIKEFSKHYNLSFRTFIFSLGVFLGLIS
jgi:hypothetical protein